MDISFYEIIEFLLLAVGAASAIVKVLEFIAKRTESKEDDVIVAKIRKAVTFAIKILEKIALNPKK